MIRKFDLDGSPIGGVVLHGLFTFKAISSPGGEIPILKEGAGHPFREKALPDSYEYKAIVDAFNSLPVEYLFTAMTAPIGVLLQRLIRSERENSIEFHLDQDAEARSAFSLRLFRAGHTAIRCGSSCASTSPGACPQRTQIIGSTSAKRMLRSSICTSPEINRFRL